jgi:Domain of unknown function (DUF222)
MISSPPRTPVVLVLPSIVGLGGLADEDLLEVQRQAGAARRRVDAVNAAIAGEIARRSDRALGHAGLAARTGASTPEKAVQQLTGVSLTDARALTSVGLALGRVLEGESPWLVPVEQGVADGTLSVASAAAITNGLGVPSSDVAADDLLTAATDLVDFAQHATPESTAKAARTLRELLDVATIADLEAHRRSRRTLTWAEQPDGMTRMVALLDPESAAIITAAIDAVLAPRRGGPRFVDTGAGGAGGGGRAGVSDGLAADGAMSTGATDDAAALLVDARSIPQLAVDTLVEIVNLATRASGSAVDQAHLFGDRSPAVRVHVQLKSLRAGVGAAYFEGRSGFVSAATADRHVCTAGILPVLFTGTHPIDAGKTQRLHTVRQRVALTAQWNGCAWHDCDRPPAMTEIHHIDAFNGQNTTLENGIPLCRFHHMELHANHWQIRRIRRPGHDVSYWLQPPDDTTHPIRLRSRNPLTAAA